MNSVQNRRTILINNVSVLIKAAIYSFSWTLLTAFFGLFQFWVTLGISAIIKTKHYSLADAIQEGSLLFFIMAVNTAITIDYYFIKDFKISPALERVIFNLLPSLILLIVIVLYVPLYIVPYDEVDQLTLMIAHRIVIGLIFIHAFIAKIMMYLHERRKP